MLCELVFRPLAQLVVAACAVAGAAAGRRARRDGNRAHRRRGLAGDNLVAAALLLQLKTVLDNADGQLARRPERESVLGRYLDSESDLLVERRAVRGARHVTGRPWLALPRSCPSPSC